jgi:hypothetical protein
MNSIGLPPENASPELLEAWTIVQGSDRSDNQKQRLDQLYQAATIEDKPKIANLIEAFIVSDSR